MEGGYTMSTEVDERVVAMSFDNKNFESNTKETMNTIEKLKQSLKFDGATKGLDNISKEAKKLSFDGLSRGVDAVKVRFSALEVMGVTALANITNSAVNAGKRLISSLTIDPIKTGLAEYETQINAVQTILANTSTKGTTIDQVNAALDTLNTYADKTIYNFTEMTRNIGTFTAAGVDLDTSVSAIQGIANVAAVSGSTAQQASTAMYQLSQALATGSVKLQDWNSVVNAGMGGEVFQNALIRTSEALKTGAKQAIKTSGSFRDSLTKSKWLTTEVLTETLEQFTMLDTEANRAKLAGKGYAKEQIDEILKMGETATNAATKVKTFTQLIDTLQEAAQSGWGQTWRLIIGDFEESKKIFTEASDVLGGIIGNAADARNELVKAWVDLGGRAEVIDIIKNSFGAIVKITSTVKEAFRDIFPPITAQRLFEITEELADLTKHLKISDETSDKLKRTFKGFFAILDIGKQAVSAVFKAISPLTSTMGNFGGNTLDITAKIGDFLVKLNETIKSTDVFNKYIGGAVKLVSGFATSVKNVLKSVGAKIKVPGLEILHGLLERIQIRMEQVLDAATSMGDGVSTAAKIMGDAFYDSSAYTILMALYKGLKIVGGGIMDLMGSMASSIANAISNVNFSGFLDIVNSVIAGGIGVGLIKFIKSATGTISSLGDITSGIVDVFDGVRGSLEAYQTQLKAGTLMKISIAIGILSASILTISLIDSGKLASSLGAITVLFTNLMGAMAIFSKISGDLTGALKASTVMLALSTSILILSVALKKISSLSFKELATGLIGVITLTGTMVAAMKIMSSGGTKAVKGAAQMVLFAYAITILADACKSLATLSWDQLAKGLVGVGTLLASVSIFLNTAKFSAKSIITATGIVILAAAMNVMAKACKTFGNMPWGNIAKGLSSVGILLAELALFTNLNGNAKKLLATGISMMAIGVAMNLFASAMIKMGNMNWESIGKGLVGIAGALAAVTLSTNLMPKNMVGIGIGLMAVSTAMVILAEAMGKFGTMSWEGIGKSLSMLGGSMLILAVGLNAMKGTLAGSAALLVAVGALALLTPVLSLLGAMSWTAIAKGLTAIAGALAIIGVAGLILTPIVPVILGLGGAIALTGVGVAGIGVGLLTVGAGLSAVAIGFAALATSGMASIAIVISGVAGLIPEVARKMGEGIIEVAKVIRDGAPVIGETVLAVLTTVVDTLSTGIPVLANGFFEIILSVFDSLIEYTPKVIDKVSAFIIEVLKGLTRNLPNIIPAAMDTLMALFKGISNALNGIDTATLLKGIIGLGLLSGIMMALSAIASLVPGAMLGALGIGVLIAEVALVLAAVGALGQIPGLSWLMNEGSKVLGEIGNAIGSFIGGIIGGVLGEVTTNLPKIGTDLSNFMTNVTPFINGAKTIDASAMTGVKALAETVLLLTAANVLDGLTSWFTGGASLSDFGKELASFAPYFKQYYEIVKGIDGSVVESSANAAKSLSEFANNLPNSGGLAAVIAGENDLGEFSKNLILYGKAIVGFSDIVKGKIDTKAVETAASSGKVLAELSKSLPNSNGAIQWITGQKDLKDFGIKLVSFGQSISAFSATVSGNVDEGAVTTAANAGNMLSALANALPEKDGALSFITGKGSISMSEFGSQLVQFGGHLARFSASIVDVDASKMSLVTSSLSYILDLGKQVKETNVKDFGSILSTLAESGVTAFTDGFKNASETVAQTIATFTSYAVGALNSSIFSFYTGGLNAAQGFINGLQTKVNDGSVYSAGRNIGEAALIAAKKALDIHSPSKEMYKVGNFTISGFVNALNKGKTTVSKAATSMMNGFVKQATKVSVVSDYTKGAIAQYAKSYVSASKSTAKQTTIATKAMSAYVNKLYEESDAYKQDKANLKSHTKALNDLYKERSKIQSSINKKGNSKSTNASLKSQLKDVDKQIKAAKKQIVKDGEDIAKSAKKVLTDIKKSIKDSVSDYLDLFSISMDTGIDMFEKTTNSLKTALDGYIDVLGIAYDSGIQLFEEFNANGAAKQQEENVKSAQEYLTQANEELIAAQEELAAAQEKSNAVNDRSQTLLDAVAEAQARVTAATESQTEAQTALNDAQKDTSVDDTLKNMESQIKGIEELQNNLTKLGERGINQGLLKYLKELGTSGADQVATFVKMTDEELQKANDLFAKSGTLNATTLITNFKEQVSNMSKWSSDMKALSNLDLSKDVKASLMSEFQEKGVESSEYLNTILSMTESQLNEFNKAYKEYLTVPQQVADEVSKTTGKYIDKSKAAADAAVKETLDSMKANVDSYKDWQKDLTTLSKSGMSDELLASLQNLGIDGAEQVKVFTQMTAAELKKANKLFKESGTLAGQTLIDNFGAKLESAKDWGDNVKKLAKLNLSADVKEALLQDIQEQGVNSAEYVNAILAMDKTQLKEFNTQYKEYLSIPNTIANEVLAAQASVNTEVAKSSTATNEKVTEVVKTATAEAEKTAKTGSKQIGTTTAKAITTGLTSGIKTGSKEITSTSKIASSDALSGLKTSLTKSKGEGVSGNMVKGMIKGFEDNTEALKKAAEDSARAALKATKEVLDINSPSGEYEEIGKFSIFGMANGLLKYAGKVKDASVKVGESALESMASTISKLAQVTTDDLDSQPTIRPVLDLTEVQNGLSGMDGMFGSKSIGVRSNTIATNISSRMNRAAEIQNGVGSTDTYDNSQLKIENTFNIAGNNPKEIATEVSQILQRQYQRKDAVWGT